MKDLYVSKIQRMAHVDDGLKRLPLVLFCWGSPEEVFKGVITKMSATYNMLTGDGIATRAIVNLRLQRPGRSPS